MSRLEIPGPDKGQLVVEELYKDLERRIESSPPGLCPVDMTRAFIEMCQTQSCGKMYPVSRWAVATEESSNRCYERDCYNGDTRTDRHTV